MDLPPVRFRSRTTNNHQTGTSRQRHPKTPQQPNTGNYNRWKQQTSLPGPILGNPWDSQRGFLQSRRHRAAPIAVVDHLQYGNPGNPEVFWTFKEAIRAIRDYLKATRVPCVGGKVSFYNEDTQTTTAIKPSPVIAAVGLRNARAPKIGSALAKEGNDLVIVGTTFPDLGGSEYYESVQGLVGGRVPRVNLKTERQLLRTITKIIESGVVEAAHDISKGGLAVSLAEMAIQGQKGFIVNLDKVPAKTNNIAQLLFSESKPRFVLESRPKNTPRIMRILRAGRIKIAKIGRVQGSKIQLESQEDSLITIPLSVAVDVWSKTLSKTMDPTISSI